MNYIKTLALLLLSISILTSCSDYEDFSSDVYSMKDTKTSENDTKATYNDINDTDSDTDGTEPNDSTASDMISIIIDEPVVEDIDYVITIP